MKQIMKSMDRKEETHSVHEIDEHVWTSPLNAVKIVEQIKEELCEIDSEKCI